MSFNAHWELPGGYIDGHGNCHRAFEIRALIGRDEELLAAENASANMASRVSELLSRCVSRIGGIVSIDKQLIQQLLVADRDYLLLMLRQLTFGDRVEAVIKCDNPGCSNSLDIDFLISDIPITAIERKPAYTLALDRDELGILRQRMHDSPGDGHGSKTVELLERLLAYPEISYRLPIGGDMELLLDLKTDNPAVASSHLLQRCVLDFGQGGRLDLEAVTALPSALRRALENEMEARAPNLELVMEVNCPVCNQGFDAPFYLQDFFFNEHRLTVSG